MTKKIASAECIYSLCRCTVRSIIPSSVRPTHEKTSTGLATTQHQGEKTMRKAIFAALAVLGLSLATTAMASAANANTYLFAPNQNEGSNS